MAIPGFQELMLPILKHLERRGSCQLRELRTPIARDFKLTAENLTEMLPSGKSGKFANRLAWAKFHLEKANLIASPKRGTIELTSAGRALLATNLLSLDLPYLVKHYPKFAAFRNNGKPKVIESPEISVVDDLETPLEIIDKNYITLRQSLSQELIDNIMTMSPAFFERLVVELLVKMGYGGSMSDAGEAIGKSGDGGIDGIIKEDKLGLDAIYIQAKRWKPGLNVGRPELHGFVGALAGRGAKKGIFITTSSFTKEAILSSH